jgi:tetratricopeptide (TPR) repeat protein
MTEQLSLFGEENTVYNTGVMQLLELDFTACRETLERYARLFPWGRDVGHELRIVEFWEGRIERVNWAAFNPEEAEKVYRVWVEFESCFGGPWDPGSFESKLRFSCFPKVVACLEALDPPPPVTLPAGTPLGLVYLLADRLDGAVSALQRLIAADPQNAQAYACLGDAYACRGDVRTARVCYREAFLMAPEQIDVGRLRDERLREYLADFLGEAPETEERLPWLPVMAQLDGLFEGRVIRGIEDLKHWVDRYLALVKGWDRTPDHTQVPKLFYRGMVLSDNADMLRFVKKVDLADIRRRMKSWEPELFSRHMRMLEAARR